MVFNNVSNQSAQRYIIFIFESFISFLIQILINSPLSNQQRWVIFWPYHSRSDLLA